MITQLSEIISIHSAYFLAVETATVINKNLPEKDQTKSKKNTIDSIFTRQQKTIKEMTKTLTKEEQVNLVKALKEDLDNRLRHKEQEEKHDDTLKKEEIQKDILAILKKIPGFKLGYNTTRGKLKRLIEEIQPLAKEMNISVEKLLNHISKINDLATEDPKLPWWNIISKTDHIDKILKIRQYLTEKLGEKIKNPNILFLNAGSTRQQTNFITAIGTDRKDYIFTKAGVFIGQFKQLNGAGIKKDYKNEKIIGESIFINGKAIIQKDYINNYYKTSKKPYRMARLISKCIYPKIDLKKHASLQNYTWHKAENNVTTTIPKETALQIGKELTLLMKNLLNKNNNDNKLSKVLENIYDDLETSLAITQTGYYGYLGFELTIEKLVDRLQPLTKKLVELKIENVVNHYIEGAREIFTRFFNQRDTINLNTLSGKAGLKDIKTYRDYLEAAVKTGYHPNLTIQEMNLNSEEKEDNKKTKGLGVIAAENLEKGEFICTYEGKWIDKDLSSKDETIRGFENDFSISLFNDYILDAEAYGGIGRFLNDDDEYPNVNIYSALVDNQPVAILVANQAVKQGTELCWFYGPVYRRPWLHKM